MPAKILLVEDEALIALDEARMLERHGYETVTAYGGEQAIELVDNTPDISLVLMDIDLGAGMDGTEAAAAILDKHELPVVFLTNHTEEEYVKRVEEITSYGIVQKASGEFFIIQAIKMACRLFAAYTETRRHERQYRLIAENSTEMITTTDNDFNLTYVSPAVTALLGYTQEEYLAKTSRELLTADSYAEAVREYTSRSPEDMAAKRLEVQMIRRDGSTVWCESFTRPFLDEQGRRIGTIVSTRDISRRKQAEEELRRSEQQAQRRLEDIKFLADTAFDFIDIHARSDIYGYIGSCLQQLAPEAYIAVNSVDRAAGVMKTEAVMGVEKNIESIMSLFGFHPVGKHYTIDSSLDGLATGNLEEVDGGIHELTFGAVPPKVARKAESLFNMGKVYAIAFMVEGDIYATATFLFTGEDDIRNRETIESFVKQASIALRHRETEEDLLQSRQQLELFINSSPDMYFLKDSELRYLFCNTANARFLETEASEVTGKTDYDFMSKATADQCRETDMQALREKQMVKNTERVGDRVYETRKIPVIEGNTVRAVAGIIRDLTEHRRMEEKLRAIADYTYDWEDWIARDGSLVWVNPAVERVTGYTPQECYQMEDYPRQLIHSDDLAAFEEDLHRGLVQELSYEQREFRCVCKDGTVKWISVNWQPIYDETGASLGIRSSMREVTSFRQARERLRSIVENAPVGFYYLDRDYRITYENPKAREIMGVPPEEQQSNAVGRDIREVPSVGRVMAPEKINTIGTEESQFQLETEFESEYGKRSFLRVYAVPIHQKLDFDGAIIMVEDITARKEVERLNEERTLYVEAILQANPNAILTLDTRNRIKEWNAGAEELFHYRKEEVMGRDLDELVGGFDTATYNEAYSLTQQVSSGKLVPPTETIRYTREGSPINVIVAGSPIMVDGEFSGIVATYTDITLLKKKEQEVTALLHEKEDLLREVHHRIKNHMSTIASIISLRANSIEDSAVINVLEEVQNKIRIMQDIYQSLYTGEQVQSVRISSFLHNLINDIQETYVFAEMIRIETNIDDIEVSAKQSLPVGIIINELLTNAIKYAFSETGQGTIKVRVGKDEEGYLRIEVSDNGTGLPEGVLERREYGFGLTLVQGYAEQFNGSFTVENGNGTTATVTLLME